MSKFVQAQIIHLGFNNIAEIPSNAFKNIVGEQDKLEILWFNGISIKKLGNNAFSQLNSLTQLYITYTSIDFIPEYAFEFNEDSDKRLVIYIYNDQFLNSSGFSEYSLMNLKRPTTIYINFSEDTHFSYLDQKIFLPFLRSNKFN